MAFLPLLTVTLLVVAFIQDCSNTRQNFGPYFITTRTMGLCRGDDKLYDKENICTSTMYINKISRTKEKIQGEIGVPKDIIHSKVSVAIQQWSDGGYKPFLNRTFIKPCSNRVFVKLMKQYGHVDDDCMIKKGNYSVQNLDTDELLHMITGENFFYQKIYISLEWYSTEGCTCCLTAECESKPLRISNKKQ